ncbi:CtIP-like endonuclease [Schizosaccharomyces japonicus yFS275]|uniref:CtIP-like endonuclease n=1 Tax=Schizosaccharomyces japonicus (strain yFS275 / FY16936) TaxID=402676 RepID=B6JXE8_SCHJY|nr:CtIP-like endonuclease [Schizosaccharomyces japonicus yFS275]EEB06049.2 CtIP-like endonuclease [Schizosaccharomyces japonicus yFS275]
MKPNSFDWKQLCAQFGDYVESLHREISSLKTALAFETELRKSLEEEINKAKAERRLTGADTKSNAAEDTEEEDVSTTEEEEEEDENDKADNIPLSRVASSVSSGSVARISAKTMPNSDDSETSMDENAPLSSIHRTATPITPRQTSKTVDNSVLASDSDSDSEGEKKLQARSLEEMILLRETQIPLTPVAANKTNKHLPQPRKARQQQPSKPIIEDDDGTTIRGHKRKTLPAFDCPDCEKFTITRACQIAFWSAEME